MRYNGGIGKTEGHARNPRKGFKMLASYLDSLSDTDWLATIIQITLVVSVPGGIAISEAGTYVIRHHDRIRAAWRMAWHILKTGGPSPRVIRSAPHQA